MGNPATLIMETYIIIQSKQKSGGKSAQLKKMLGEHGVSISDDCIAESPSFTSAVSDAGSILLQGDVNILLLLNVEENFEYAKEMLESSMISSNQRFLIRNNNFASEYNVGKIVGFLDNENNNQNLSHIVQTLEKLLHLKDEHDKFQHSFYKLFGNYTETFFNIFDSCFELCLELISKYILDDSIIHPSIGTELQWFAFESDFGRNKYNRVEIDGEEIVLDSVEKFVQYMLENKKKKENQNGGQS